MLPFAHLNLRRNPFGELTAPERATLAVVDLDAAAAALDAGAIVQLVAPHGRGKTTHLLALHARHAGAPFRRAGREGIFDLPTEGVAFVDEVDVLDGPARRALWVRAGALAVATHVDHGREIRLSLIHI